MSRVNHRAESRSYGKEQQALAVHLLPSEGFIREPLFLKVLPVCRSTLWAGIKDGRYPAPVKLSPRVSAWHVQAVRQLLSELADAAQGV